jgi:DNA mismatch repair protein MutS
MAGAVLDGSDTPLMRQYLEVKDRYPDTIVFFRLGDFYEMFFDDAVVVARTLDLTLTTRDKGKENPVPMCGVPHHAAKHYLAKLVERGFKVAICDQVEDPKVARGIVRREVVRVVTPGVVLDEEQLDPKAAHYLCAAIAANDGERVGIAYLDVTTGEFAATEIERAELVDELARIAPREVLVAGVDPARLRVRVPAAYVELPGGSGSGTGDPGAVRAVIEEALGGARVDAELTPLALAAAAATVTYARETQPRGALPLTRLTPYRAAEHLILDEATRANLELFQTIQGGKRVGSLLAILDETRTSMGGRLLRRWLAAPLVDVAAIRRRLDAVEWLVEKAALRAELRGELAEIYDLERLAGRATLGVATPRDLVALARSLERLPRVRALLHAGGAELAHPELLELGEDLADDVARTIRRQLADDPPVAWRDGGFVRRGYSPELDELMDLSAGGRNKILEIEARERERTGIASLKVRYNRVFGYYIEITRANLDRIPPDYVRKQTLANAERFVTPELADYEARILGADERRVALELEAFERLRVEIAGAAARLLRLGELTARLDALAALAEVAHTSDWSRPDVDDSLALTLEDARHPVVEKLAAAGKFVPNDLALDPADAQLVIITGPNMAGKSTVMRQAALITILAQVGSFVPARRARVGIADRVFTRVGASDNLARGDSTFMVEMRETAHILSHATRRSLVVLDEIGRGTSTYDGMAIAWAVAEHLHDRVGCKTLFATHYHELTALERARPRVRNFSTAVREWKDDVIFLHKLQPGGASRSYGIQVARLAGLEKSVIARAREIVTAFERGDDLGGALPAAGAKPLQPSLPFAGGAAAAHAAGPASARDVATSADARARPPLSDIERQLAAADVDGMSPREALAFLADLQARLKS